MSKGYMGKVLMVDLSRKTSSVEDIPDKVYNNYLSGTGLGAYILYNRIPAGADPLGPKNILGMVSGLLTGTGALFAGRWSLVGKSPLTGGWGDANCGGSFSPAIKRCGFDGIFFSGTSKTPVYLYVKNGEPEIRNASDLWGKDAVETEDILVERHGPGAKVACIGMAGEKISLISGVCNDRGRIAARSGLGAVMGSKKLKAVVLDGKIRIQAHDRESIIALSKKLNKWVNFQFLPISGKASAFMGWLLGVLPVGMAMDGMLYKLLLKKWGTSSMNRMSVGMGDSPLKNWKGSYRDFGYRQTASIDPDLIKKREKKKYHCYSCPLGCGGICSIEGKYGETHKPEYETVLALGGLCMNEDMEEIFYLNELLNRAGMDTISAGATVSFAMECYEKGILTQKDTGGLDLTWGNSQAVRKLIEMMISREGIGDILADGTKVASQRIGKNSKEFAVHAGGQEPAMHDGRQDPGFAVHYSVEPTPGRHTIGAQMYYEMFQLWKTVKSLPKVHALHLKKSRFAADKNKAVKSVACSRFMNVVNGAGLCLFGVFIGSKRIRTFDYLNAATGWDRSPEDYMEIGGKIQTLKQSFNIKQGIDPRSFRIHGRAAGEPPQKEGMNRGRTIPVEQMIKDYWEQSGWDPATGKPTAESMSRLKADI